MATSDETPKPEAIPPPRRERVDPESGEIVVALPADDTEEGCGC